MVINQSVYFGKNFRRTFKYHNTFLSLNKQTKQYREYMAELILKDDNLAASLAAAKWVASVNTHKGTIYDISKYALPTK